MIKRIRFATRKGEVALEEFTIAWRDALAAGLQAPPDCRPLRISVSTTLPDRTGLQPKHDAVGVEWFDDIEQLARFEAWPASPPLPDEVDRQRSPVFVADEVVLRGAEWLEQRWRGGGERLKHMAIARRANGLTPAEFSERWRNHAGQVSEPGASAPTAIPPQARGLAYVQNHPHPGAAGDWAYDALNEVWFDDAEALQTRVDWFADNPSGDDLFGESWFLVALEEVLH